jgi:hypothetical protein
MEHRFFFFAGGDYREGKGNAFTANFIRYQKEILGDRFSLITGIYGTSPVGNVIWALNRAQAPLTDFDKHPLLATSISQIIDDPRIRTSKITLVSSSFGSVVAAQTACKLAELHLHDNIFSHPFDIALGASMIHPESKLYRQLQHYQNAGVIGKVLYDDLQDEGDNSNGMGGLNRMQGYRNGLGICFPFLTTKFKGPSFLNNDPVKGHLHRVRAQSMQKAKDFVKVIFVDHEMAGEDARERAFSILSSSPA